MDKKESNEVLASFIAMYLEGLVLAAKATEGVFGFAMEKGKELSKEQMDEIRETLTRFLIFLDNVEGLILSALKNLDGDKADNQVTFEIKYSLN